MTSEKNKFIEACEYYFGFGVDIDVQKSLDLLEKSAIEGYAVAQYNLAKFNDIDSTNPLDNEVSKKWYREASKSAHAYANYDLGKLYEREGNKIMTAKHYVIAANLGVLVAIERLNKLYGNKC